jgi:hypothetical protein
MATADAEEEDIFFFDLLSATDDWLCFDCEPC